MDRHTSAGEGDLGFFSAVSPSNASINLDNVCKARGAVRRRQHDTALCSSRKEPGGSHGISTITACRQARRRVQLEHHPHVRLPERPELRPCDGDGFPQRFLCEVCGRDCVRGGAASLREQADLLHLPNHLHHPSLDFQEPFTLERFCTTAEGMNSPSTYTKPA